MRIHVIALDLFLFLETFLFGKKNLLCWDFCWGKQKISPTNKSQNEMCSKRFFQTHKIQNKTSKKQINKQKSKHAIPNNNSSQTILFPTSLPTKCVPTIFCPTINVLTQASTTSGASDRMVSDMTEDRKSLPWLVNMLRRWSWCCFAGRLLATPTPTPVLLLLFCVVGLLPSMEEGSDRCHVIGSDCRCRVSVAVAVVVPLSFAVVVFVACPGSE